MDRLPLSGGSYSARSIIASALRCINYYPEANPRDAPVPFTYYQRPGKIPIVLSGDIPPRAPCRGLYMASNGSAYAVIGSSVFRISEVDGAAGSWSLKKLGEITADLTTPVSMIDNGGMLLIVDGSGEGWQIALQAISVTVNGNIYDNQTIDHIVGANTIGTTGLAAGMLVQTDVQDVPAGTRISSVLSEDTITISTDGRVATARFVGQIDKGSDESGTTLTVHSLSSAQQLEVGMVLIDDHNALVADTSITAFGTGSGGTGTYTVSSAQLVPSESMRATHQAGGEITFQCGEDFFAPVSDAGKAFQGADRVDYIDGFIIWNVLNSHLWGSTLFSNAALLFDPTYVVGKTDYPDKLVSLIVNRHEIILLGRVKSEMWYDAGGSTFPFAELPGAFIEHGLVAKYSLASADVSVFWLGRDLQGQGVVWRQQGYKTLRISNHALELTIRQMRRIDDAIGYTLQVDGHYWYVLHFPTADQTWVFDDSIGEPREAWHQEGWSDDSGVLHRDRANCHALIFGKNVVGDWENGTLYELDLDTYTDEVEGVVYPIVCTKSFQHIRQVSRSVPGGGPVFEHPTNGRMVQFTKFWLDLECGTSPLDIDGRPAMISLRWSDDRGRTFGNDVLQSSGALGEYLTQPQWPGIGIARDRIFEISHSIAAPAALNGAWIEAHIVEE